jgi:hypothetical protein
MRSSGQGCTEAEVEAAANPRTKALGGVHRVDSFQKWLDSAGGWWTVLFYVVEIAGCLCLSAFPAIVLYHDMKHDTSLMGEQWEDENGSSWSKVSVVDLVGTLLSVLNWLLLSATTMMTLTNAHLPVLHAVTTPNFDPLTFEL